MDSDNYIPFKVRISQIVGLKKLLVSKAEIETLIAGAVKAAKAEIELLIVKKAEIEALISKTIETEGITLHETEAVKPALVNAISWKDAAKNLAREQLSGISFANTSNLRLEAGVSENERETGIVDAWARAVTAYTAHLKLQANKTAGQSYILAALEGKAPEIERIVLDSLERSAWLQLIEPGIPKNLRVVRGSINSAGTPVVGEGFTASRLGLGSYEIKYALGSSPGIVTVTASQFNRVGRIVESTQAKCVVNFVSLAEAAADTAFHFIAIG
jgi:hypothetical protein